MTFFLSGSSAFFMRPDILSLGPHEPTVKMKVGGQTMTSMVDTGAEHSVVTFPRGPL